MYFAQTALAAACFVIFVIREYEAGVGSHYADPDEGDTDSNLVDNHTFVALLDIVFTDNSKRTCTGSIIHDNVIITAAHCFFSTGKDPKYKVGPELTASFVVIGTKAMFDTGYEQYLPIERVVTHPKYNMWTADLSLVYTFSGMISDKPGTLIPLAGEKKSIDVNFNVTVLSWGRIARMNTKKSSSLESQEFQSKKKDDRNTDSDWNDSCNVDEDDDQDESTHDKKYKESGVTASLNGKHFRNSQIYKYNKKKKRSQKRTHKNKKHNQRSKKDKFEEERKVTKKEKQTIISRYLTALLNIAEKDNDDISDTAIQNHDNQQQETKNYNDVKRADDSTETTKFFKTSQPISEQSFKTNESAIHDKQERPQKTELESFYTNWRRTMGTQQNQLTVENFGFISLQACKSLIDRANSDKYDISEADDLICYSSADRFIEDNDSGAPAIRHGKLVAVTVGGVEYNGDYAAVGMKISCYCSWIADNLPQGAGKKIKCCKNCCSVKHKEETRSKTKIIQK